MKKIILGLVLMLSFSLYALTYTVGLDQSFDFQSIQSAIDNAVNGDSIIVHPGVYYENIDFTGKSLFLGSLFSLTADTTYISQTIIDGQKLSNVITMIDVDEATVEGFTIQNGHANRQAPYHSYLSDNITSGGGLKIINFQESRGGLKIISNNIIKNNYANFGGGVWSVGAQVHFRGNNIYRNSAITDGGGIYFDRFEIGGEGKNTPASIEKNKVPIFSSEDKNSVYYNTSGQFNDIRINRVYMLDIPLKIGTYAEHIWLQIGNVDASSKPLSINVTIEEGFIEMVDADLYVSPDGDDSNSGLSPEEALKTITMAMLKQKGNIFEYFPSVQYMDYLAWWRPASEYLALVDSLSAYRNTIYIADGVYSEETGNLFPIRVKNHVRVIGESRENTIIDLGGKHHGFVAGYISGSPLPFPYQIIPSYTPFITHYFLDIENFTIKNSFSNDYLREGGRSLYLEVQSDCVLKINNIKYTDSEVENSGAGYIGIDGGYKVDLSNIHLIQNNTNPHHWGRLYAIKIRGGEVYLTLENIIIDGGLGGIYLTAFGITNICNLLIKNLYSTNDDSMNHAIYVSGGIRSNPNEYEYFIPVKIMNATICDNNLSSGLMNIRNHVLFDVYNTIFYNNNPNDIVFSLDSIGISIFSHNLFDQSEASLVNNYPGWPLFLENNMFDSNPLFIGSGEHPEMLHYTSPAVFAGTLDILDYYTHPALFDLPPYEMPEFDLVGAPLISNGLINMGAYAYYATENSNEEAIPLTSQLYSNYPNPFNPETNIRYYLNSDSNVSLEVFNIKGQKVKTLDKGFRKDGEYLLTWNGTDDNNRTVGSGIYFYRLKTEDFSATQKMLLLK